MYRITWIAATIGIAVSAAAASSDCDGDASCTVSANEEADEISLLQKTPKASFTKPVLAVEAEKPQKAHPRVPKVDQTHRVRIVNKTLRMTDSNGDDCEIVALGGNYVMKAHPYFPPEEVIRADARSMYQGTQIMKYRPSGKKVLPVVRLGTMLEGAMPYGPNLDPDWTAKLERAVQIFADEGVYVVLDSHSDTWASTNGGEGFPWWMMAYMQNNSETSYVVSPKHPFRTVIPDILTEALANLGMSVPIVRIVDDNNPWFNYSIDDKEPWKMNVGNLNMRANNDDEQWSNGVLVLSQQSNNIAQRFYTSHSGGPQDRERIFEPFVHYMKYLAVVWQDHPNVIAIEMLNEPPIAGLPNLEQAILGRRELFNFYHELLDELDAVPAIYAFQDILGSVGGASPVDTALGILPLPTESMAKIKERAYRGQLMFAIHYYYGVGSSLTFEGHIKKAQASEFGEIMPLFLSEYWDETPEQCAMQLRQASELSVNMVTYWHYTDSNFTGNPGWFKYSPEVQDAGGPGEAWGRYSKTVEDDTYWGADITGARGGKSEILKLL